MIFSLTPKSSIQKQPPRSAAHAAQVVDPVGVVAEVAAEADAAVVAADAEAEKCRTGSEWAGAPN